MGVFVFLPLVWGAAAGTAVSAMSSANSAVTLLFILHAATHL